MTEPDWTGYAYRPNYCNFENNYARSDEPHTLDKSVDKQNDALHALDKSVDKQNVIASLHKQN